MVCPMQSGEELDAPGVVGVGLTTTATVPAADGHPPTVMV